MSQANVKDMYYFVKVIKQLFHIIKLLYRFLLHEIQSYF